MILLAQLRHLKYGVIIEIVLLTTCLVNGMQDIIICEALVDMLLSLWKMLEGLVDMLLSFILENAEDFMSMAEGLSYMYCYHTFIYFDAHDAFV